MNMDHRTTSQEASANGHRNPESAAPAHAPTPWRSIMSDRYVVGPNGYFVASTVQGQDGFRSTEAAANTALIVKAVNNHDALVKALTDTLCELTACASQLATRGLKGREGDSVSRAQKAARETLSRVTTAQ